MSESSKVLVKVLGSGLATRRISKRIGRKRGTKGLSLLLVLHSDYEVEWETFFPFDKGGPRDSPVLHLVGPTLLCG